MLGRHWRSPEKRERSLQKLDRRALARFVLAADGLIADLAREPARPREDGEIWTYVAPSQGQEHRWLTAAVLADHVVLNRPDWMESAGFGIFSYRSLTEELAEEDGPPKAKPAQPAGPDDDFLDEAVREVEGWIAGGREQLSERLPTWARAYARLLAGASDQLDAGKVRFVDAWDRSWSVVVHQISQRYDDWGKNEFGQRLDDLLASEGSEAYAIRDPVRETVSFYEARQRLASSMGFVPSGDAAGKTAKLFFSHWRELSFGFPMVAGVAGEPVDDPGVDEMRPALFDEIVLPELRFVPGADPVALSEAVEDPALREFKGRIKDVVREVRDAPTMEACAARIAEARLEVRDWAKDSRESYERRVEQSRRRARHDTVWDFATTGAGVAIGFFVSGPIGAIAAPFAGWAIRTALKGRRVEPETPATPEPLLFRL